MTMSQLTTELERLRIQVMAYAALGAALKLRAGGHQGDPKVVESLEDVATAVQPNLLDGLTAADAATSLAPIQNFMSEAADLIANAGRPAGWSHNDPEFLQKLGIASANSVREITTVAASRPTLAAILHAPGRFLDVGTGVAALGIAAARAWPAMQVVGIDIFAPALELALANVATSGVADRVELREQSVQDVPDRDAFNLIWLPTVFIPGEIVASVLASLRPTLAPGGVLMVAITKIPDDKVGAAVARLRAVRAGGYPWSADEIAKRLRELDYGDVEILPSGTHSQRIIGRRTS